MSEANTPSSMSGPSSNPQGSPASPVSQPGALPGIPSPAPPVSAPVDPFADRFQALSQKQKEYFNQKKTLEAKEREIAEKEGLFKLIDENPAEFFKKKGLDLNDLLRKVAGEPQPVESKVEALQKKLEEYEQREKEREEKKKQDDENQVIQKHVAEFKKSVQAEVSADKDRWEAINHTESFEIVFDVCENYFNEHGEIPPIEWAADQVETHLVEQAKKYSTIKKIAPKIETPPDPRAFGQKTPAPTITNNLVPEPRVPDNKNYLDDDESRAKAAQLLKWS